jgi:hypothetical protein
VTIHSGSLAIQIGRVRICEEGIATPSSFPAEDRSHVRGRLGSIFDVKSAVMRSSGHVACETKIALATPPAQFFEMKGCNSRARVLVDPEVGPLEHHVGRTAVVIVGELTPGVVRDGAGRRREDGHDREALHTMRW